MIETIESILVVTTFIAVGGTVAAIFLFLFVNSSLRMLHKQIEKLIDLNTEILKFLRQKTEGKK